MAISLLKLCTALGLKRPVSICRDVLGFEGGRVPAALAPARPQPEVRLNRFAELLMGQHFHVRLIVAGSDLLTANDESVIDYAVFRLREIYSAAGIGVGRVTRDLRTAANSGGHATVNNQAEIEAAAKALTADGDFVPVVMPANMNVTVTNPDGKVIVTLGHSPIPGPCLPRTGERMKSAVVDIAEEGTGRTLAHEVGHYLGAEHPTGLPGNNLMAQTGTVANPFLAVDINEADRAIMRGHCTIRRGLQGIAVSDFTVVDPAQFTVEELMSAVRGGTAALKPQLAVTLLKAKLGETAVPQLTDLARDAGIEPRARHAATLALASFPSARQVLVSLSTSPDRLVADTAAQALQQSNPKED